MDIGLIGSISELMERVKSKEEQKERMVHHSKTRNRRQEQEKSNGTRTVKSPSAA